MSTVSNVKHLIAADCFKIKTKIKAFQKPSKNAAYKNTRNSNSTTSRGYS